MGAYQSKAPPRDCLLKAQQRQSDLMQQGTAQMVAGRTFEGQAFVSHPPEILFKDFEVGKTRKTRITLTNVSLSFNSFKIKNLPDSIVDFFIVSYEKPGRMSAGTSCVIDIAFTPQINKDIIAEVTRVEPV